MSRRRYALRSSIRSACATASWRVLGSLGASLALGGCYASHVRDGDGGPRADAFVVDAPLAPIDAASADAGPDAYVEDAFVGDAGPICETPTRPLRACVLNPSGRLATDAPTTIALFTSDCTCPGDVQCLVDVDDAHVHLSARLCGHTECDSCSNEVECVIPPLTPVARTLRLDGDRLGTVVPRPRGPVDQATPRCFAVQEPPPAELVCGDTIDVSVASATACLRRTDDVGTYFRVELRPDCAPCSTWSAGCEASIEGFGNVVVRPAFRACEAPEGCASVCSETSVVCNSPALRSGDYTVRVEDPRMGVTSLGTVQVRDIVTPGAPECVTLP